MRHRRPSGRFARCTPSKARRNLSVYLGPFYVPPPYWNTLYLDRAVQHLGATDIEFDLALLAHLSPMGWAHISLTGDYLWDQAKRISAGEFRPLNDPLARLKLVA